jgi:hypothetical protein
MCLATAVGLFSPGAALPAAYVDRPLGFPAPAMVATVVHPCGVAVRACVDLRSGLAWLQRDGRVSFGPVRIATGSGRSRTPRGRFHVAWKVRAHRSSIYGIRMPYSVFFADGGIAFHQGPLGLRSHGCIHLAWRAARKFFTALHRRDVVVVR